MHERVDAIARFEAVPAHVQVSRMSRLALFAFVCGAVASCSTFQPQPPDPAISKRLSEVQAVAGAPVSSFRYMRMSSFEPIGLRNLLVFTTPREAWLLRLDGQCRNLDFEPFLGLTSHMHRVSSGFDSVRVRDNPIPCRIEEIRPVDTANLKRIDRERAAPDQQPMDDETPPPKS